MVLNEEDILDSLDCPYHFYIQGGIAYEGKIYFTEGSAYSEENRPVIRVIDLEKQTQTDHADLMKMGYNEEPEMIDFSDGICYYSDAHGHLYTIKD